MWTDLTFSSDTVMLCGVLTHSPDKVKTWHGVSVATTSRKVHTFRGGEYVAALMAELSRAAIAQRIATARKQAGLDQPELADLMHVHFRTIQDWESPKKQATPWDRLDELAAVTDVSKEWLLHGERAEVVADAPSILRRLGELADLVADLNKLNRQALEALAAQSASASQQARRQAAGTKR